MTAKSKRLQSNFQVVNDIISSFLLRLSAARDKWCGSVGCMLFIHMMQSRPGESGQFSTVSSLNWTNLSYSSSKKTENYLDIIIKYSQWARNSKTKLYDKESLMVRKPQQRLLERSPSAVSRKISQPSIGVAGTVKKPILNPKSLYSHNEKWPHKWDKRIENHWWRHSELGGSTVHRKQWTTLGDCIKFRITTVIPINGIVLPVRQPSVASLNWFSWASVPSKLMWRNWDFCGVPSEFH